MTRRSWALFAAMCVIWGVPYLLIRVAVRDFSPGTLVFARTAIGGLVLLPFALASGGFRPVLRRGLDVGQVRATALLEMALVAIGYAVAPVIMARRLADLPSIPVVAASLLLASIGYLPYAVLNWPHSITAHVAWSVIVLGVV